MNIEEQIKDILNKYRTTTEVGSLRDIAVETTNLLKQQEQEIREDVFYKWFKREILLDREAKDLGFVQPLRLNLFKRIKALAINEVHERVKNERWYYEHREDIYRLLSEGVAQVMFLLDRVGALSIENKLYDTKEIEKYLKQEEDK